jgi:hypothetical protein
MLLIHLALLSTDIKASEHRIDMLSLGSVVNYR